MALQGRGKRSFVVVARELAIELSLSYEAVRGAYYAVRPETRQRVLKLMKPWQEGADLEAWRFFKRQFPDCECLLSLPSATVWPLVAGFYTAAFAERGHLESEIRAFISKQLRAARMKADDGD